MIKILKFTATWCKPCKILDPILLKLKESHEDIVIEPIDKDDFSEMSSEYKIRSVPTLIFLKDQQEKQRISGVQTLENLERILVNL